MAVGEEMGARGVLQGGERLQPVTTGTTVRVRDDEVVTSDGPFAETKEQIGGYYLVDCKDLDEAIEVASKIPGARHGSIEVRPIWELWATSRPRSPGPSGTSGARSGPRSSGSRAPGPSP